MSRSAAALFLLVVLAGAAPAAEPARAEVPRELLKARADAAREAYEAGKKEYMLGVPGAPLSELPQWSGRWLTAQLALCATRDDRVAAFQAHLDRMKDLEAVAKKMVEQGLGTRKDVAGATYFRLDAEVKLLEAKGK
jgi:hypothetical protein